MATARSRSFDDRVSISGTYLNVSIGSTQTQSRLDGARGACADVIGNPTGVNPLGITRVERHIPGLSGVLRDQNGVQRVLTNWPLGYQVDSPDPRGVFPALSTLDLNNLSWKLRSEANPSAPDVSVPTVLAELKDVPSLMRSWYALFARPRWKSRRTFSTYWTKLMSHTSELIASGHLTWRWAVAPFVRDLRAMLEVQANMSKRMLDLQKLSNGGSIKRRVQLRQDAKRVRTARVLNSNGIWIEGWTDDSYTEKVWGCISYSVPQGPKSLDSLVLKDNAKLRSLAYRLSYGITTYEALATAWELMPWSWLIDWFTGLGTVINGLNNTLGLVGYNGCIMRHTECETTMTIDPTKSGTWAKPTSFYRTSYERKERFLSIPLLPFAPSYLPLLTRKAGLILGSLYILRVRPGDSFNRSLSKLLRRK